MTITKSDLAKTLQAFCEDKVKLSVKDATTVIDEFIHAVHTSLDGNSTVRLNGFGTFSMKRVAERKGRNPRTGEEVIIPAHNKVHFKASSVKG